MTRVNLSDYARFQNPRYNNSLHTTYSSFPSLFNRCLGVYHFWKTKNSTALSTKLNSKVSHSKKTLVHISLYFVGLKFQSNYLTCIQVCLRYEAKININTQIRYSYIPYRVVYNSFSPRIKKSKYLPFLTEKYLYNTWSYSLKELWTFGQQCYIFKEHHLKHC